MNTSVFRRLNFVDAIIIVTSYKLIFRPILAKIPIKLPNPLTLKQYSFNFNFNHLLKLKTQKQKPKPEPVCLDLPDDIIVTILSKVDDIVTLRRCTLALSQDSQDAILPRIVSFSTPLNASMFIPDKSGCWYGRLFNKIISNNIVLLLIILGSDSVIPETVIKLTADVFWWINMPELKPEAVNFFEKLTGLKSLEIELPAMPCYNCRVSPHLWFKWDARIGVYDNVTSYGVYVFGDKAADSESHTLFQMLRAMKSVVYHIMLHCSVMDLGCVGAMAGGDWKTGMSITTKDAEGNGVMMIGPKSIRNDGEVRLKIFHLPSTLKFNRYTNEQVDPLQLQDVMLLFLAYDDASVDQIDNDFIMTCLADMGDEEREADQKTVLREIVAQILTDENCVVIYNDLP